MQISFARFRAARKLQMWKSQPSQAGQQGKLSSSDDVVVFVVSVVPVAVTGSVFPCQTTCVRLCAMAAGLAGEKHDNVRDVIDDVKEMSEKTHRLTAGRKVFLEIV